MKTCSCRTQNPQSAMACRFKSGLGHQEKKTRIHLSGSFFVCHFMRIGRKKRVIPLMRAAEHQRERRQHQHCF